MRYWYIFLVLCLHSCLGKSEQKTLSLGVSTPVHSKVSLYVLGTIQDGGSPHIGCNRECCADLFQDPDDERKVVALGIVDHENKKSYLFEATPDMPSQLKSLKGFSGKVSETPDGIFLTHAHIGHYTGLMFLGREALGAKKVPVYAMPQMKLFLENNGPWNQLVDLENIVIRELSSEHEVILSPNLKVVPFKVPHRDEYSETVGYKIHGPGKTVLFIPDIDKWSKWEKSIVAEISEADIVFLDATFFDGDEINARDISEIPHPFVVESMALFENLPPEERAKVHFIHFNHTNPLLQSDGESHTNTISKGFNVAKFHQKINL